MRPTKMEEKHKCMLFVDAGPRMNAGKWLYKLAGHLNATRSDCLDAFRERWLPYFHYPEKLLQPVNCHQLDCFHWHQLFQVDYSLEIQHFLVIHF